MSTLLVSSVGGHLAQLHRLAPTLQGVDQERLWVTFDTPQSRSLLAGEEVIFLDYTGPRDVKNVLRHALGASRLFAGRHPFSSAISTGSGLALSVLPVARLRGARCHYIESFTRSEGPSLTGRLLQAVPGIHLYSQYPGWAHGRWQYSGSVFDAFAPGPALPRRETIRRAVVTLGTMQHYSFRRLIDTLLPLLQDAEQVLWQVGCTDVSELPIRTHVQIGSRELSAAMRDADVVIAHAGCGSAMSALEAGKKPVLVPRETAYEENVDDHQALLAAELGRRELAVVRSPTSLRYIDLLRAAEGRIETGVAARFRLSA